MLTHVPPIVVSETLSPSKGLASCLRLSTFADSLVLIVRTAAIQRVSGSIYTVDRLLSRCLLSTPIVFSDIAFLVSISLVTSLSVLFFSFVSLSIVKVPSTGLSVVVPNERKPGVFRIVSAK